jgi:predicted Zn-dependent protease
MRLLTGKVGTILLLVLLLLVGIASYWISEQIRFRSAFRSAGEALQRRDFQTAGSHLDRCLALRPGDLSIRLLTARTARRRGDLDEARRHLSLYEREGGPKPASELERQLLRIQGGSVEETSALFNYCSGEHPEEPDTPYVLETLAEWGLRPLEDAAATGITFEQLHASGHLLNLHHAIALWSRLRPGRADRVQGLVWRGRAHVIATDYPDALADFREALELDPSHFDARERLARVLVRLFPDEAAIHLQALKDRDSRNNAVRLSLAGCRRTLGQLDEAAKLLDQLLADRPGDVTTLTERALVDLDRQRPEEAGRILRQALALAPDHPEVRLALNRCCRLEGKRQEANLHLDRFRRLDAEREGKKEEVARRIEADQKRRLEEVARKRQKIPAGS